MKKTSLFIVLAAVVNAYAGPAAGTIDAFSTTDESVTYTSAGELTTLDAFSTTAEYIAFATPVTTIDAWAVAGDLAERRLLRDTDPDVFDVLAVPGDEKVSYKPYTRFEGGYGYGKKRVVILMYHRFREFPNSKYEVAIDEFKWQMDYIEESGYEVISLDRYVESLYANNPDLIPNHSVIITIDDGFECVRRLARPVLEEHGFPYTVSLYTDYINVGGRSMSWPEVRELAQDPLVTIASHSISHPNLASKTRTVSAGYNTWLWREIAGSKTILENALGIDVDYFCWPYGSFNAECLNVAIAAGYKGLLTVSAGKNDMDTSPFALRRYGVYSTAPRSVFAKIILGKATYEEELLFEYAGDAAEEFLIP